jgi:hypothetical protein
MTTRILCAACVLTASVAFAQSPSPVPAPQPKLLPPAAIPATSAPPAAPAVPSAPQPPSPPAQNVNVKVELQITEDGGATPAVKKNITVVVGDFSSGYVREQGATARTTAPGAPVPFQELPMQRPLNFDVRPQILPGGKIRLTCTIQYTASPASDGRSTDIKQNLVLVLESGKPLVVSQATDPVTDRRVTVEVTATTLK